MTSPPLAAPALDHLVLAAPDLDEAVAWLAAATGVAAAPGGSHAGWGTANCLAGLGGGAYLEIVGPDARQPDFTGPRPFGVDRLRRPRLVTWALRVTGIEAAVARARRRGYDPGPAQSMSRTRPDGVRLEWRLTAPGEDGGLVPFLIDWGGSPHPSQSGLPALELTGLHGRHPRPAEVAATLAALDAPLEVRPGTPEGLAATVRGPDGELRLD